MASAGNRFKIDTAHNRMHAMETDVCEHFVSRLARLAHDLGHFRLLHGEMGVVIHSIRGEKKRRKHQRKCERLHGGS